MKPKMSIGNQLKKARQRKQVTIKEAYQQTRIHPDIILALEEERFDRIPNPTYTRSFLKEYALYLKLNPRKILDLYGRVAGETETIGPGIDLPRDGIKVPKADMKKIIVRLRNVLPIIIIILALLLLFKAFTWTKAKISAIGTNRAKRVETVKPTSNIQPADKADADKISIPAGEQLQLSVTVNEDVWMQLKADGKIVFSDTLKKGSTETWKADKNFELWSGIPAAMTITLNRHRLGPLGRGVKKGIIIDREGIRK